MKKNDKVLIAAVLVIAAVCAIVLSFRGAGKEAVVYRNGTELYRFDLASENQISVKYDEEEYNEVVIKDGKVSVVHATCPDRICVEQGEISEEGETIVCLPHKLVIEIQ